MNIMIDGYDFWNMQAQKYWSFPSSYSAERKRKEAKDLVFSEAYIGSTKHDGAWNMIIKDMDGKFHLRSRTESVNGGYTDKAEWIPHICKELDCIPNGTVLLGEIYFPNNEGSRKITSVLNCLKDKCLDRQKKNGYLHFYIFDVLAYNGKNIIEKPIETRVDTYLNYKLLDVLQGEYVEIAEYKQGEELWNLYGEVIASGGEGIVITKKSAPYMPGLRKARYTLKMKKELSETIDAFIDGAYKPATKLYSGKELPSWSHWLNEKTGERLPLGPHYDKYMAGDPIVPVTKPYYINAAGAISFSLMKDGKPEHIAYISGVPDEMKIGIVQSPDKWIGKVYELSAMEIEKCGDTYSLRHGKVVGPRADKTAAQCEWNQIEQS